MPTPTEALLRQWATAEWVEYQAWLFHYSYLSLNEWQAMRAEVATWQSTPCISLVTPTYNTPLAFLQECVLSMQMQTYPFWEWCIVDDGSQSLEVRAYLQQLSVEDPRIRVYFSPKNQGICGATNHAIAMATSDYVGFLDHDDRLAPEALFYVAQAICQCPDLDILYTDRDMISPENRRFMHLFKPHWSPETLLSGNYLFHLMVYKRQLLNELGGVRLGFEGSQDYDLILRASEQARVIKHLNKILYHWRQHPASVALAHNVKEYAYQAGVRALNESIQRRKIKASVQENPHLWRGNYFLHFPATELPPLIVLNKNHSIAEQIQHAMQKHEHAKALIFISEQLHPLAEQDSYQQLIGWLQIHDVIAVTAKIIDTKKQLRHAGLVQKQDGSVLSLYEDFPIDTAGYMAVTNNARNVSLPHPACFAIKRRGWANLYSHLNHYQTAYALFAAAQDWRVTGDRVVYQPFACFSISANNEQWQYASQWHTNAQYYQREQQRFAQQYAQQLQQGDPYYSPYLTTHHADMGVELAWNLSPPCLI